MKNRREFLLSTAAAGGALAVPALAKTTKVRGLPPRAAVRPVTETYFGTRVTDNYRWMESNSAEFKSWLNAQGDYARARLNALPGRPALGRLFDRYFAQRTDAALLAVNGDNRLIYRFDAEHPLGRLFFGAPDAERMLFDPKDNGNPAAKSRNVDWQMLSPTGKVLALGVSDGGSEDSATMFLDTATGAATRIGGPRARGSGWLGDGSGLFIYRLRADAKRGAPDYQRGGSAWLHKLGTDPAADRIVFRPGEGDVFDEQSSDEPYVAGAPGSSWLVGVHMLNDTLPNQIYVAPEDDVLGGKAKWRRVVGPDAKAESYALAGDTVYVLGRGRVGEGEIVAINAKSGSYANGRVLLKGGPGQRLKGMAVARDGTYAIREGRTQDELLFIGKDGTTVRVKAPAGTHIGTLVTNPTQPGAFAETYDLLTPYLNYHFAAPDAPAVPTPLYKSDFDASAFRRVSADVKARDGTMIPIDMLMPSNAKRGALPVLINAYGAYGKFEGYGFSPYLAAQVASGLVIVIAYVRGGGVNGEDWHVAGQKATKPNTWRDAIDVGRWLVTEGWTKPQHLAIQGGSAGGIMVGRAITEAPELFAAAIGNVGIFDALRMETTANGPGNVSEFGTVKKEDEFRALLAMDSVQAVKDRTRYPAVLLSTGLNDGRVDPWLPGKFAARLQAAAVSPSKIWLKVDKDSGHGSSSIDDLRQTFVDEMAFVHANA